MDEQQARRELERAARKPPPVSTEDVKPPQHIGKPLSDVFDLKKYSGIQTVYRGIEFRSRTEARYAAWFDQCGWRWEYEPFDLAGWIPDFSLGPRGVLVEIKPFVDLDQWQHEMAKIRHANPQRAVALFGESPTVWIDHQDDCAPKVGWLMDWHDGHWYYEDGPCDLHFGYTEGNNELGLCSLDGAWWNLIWKAPPNHSHPNKWSRVHLAKSEVEQHLSLRWAHACNLTKWKPSDGRGNR